MKKIKAEQVVSACAARVGAIKKFLGAKDQIFVGGESLTSADLARRRASAAVHSMSSSSLS